MRKLREQEQLLMGEEEHHNLFDGLQDIRYARDFLRVVGPLGTAEHARFDEMSWGYGDPTYMGGDLLEVFDSQLKSVVHTLFGVVETHEQEEAEDDQDALTPLRADLYHIGIAMGEDDLLDDLVSARWRPATGRDGRPDLTADYGRASHPPSPHPPNIPRKLPRRGSGEYRLWPDELYGLSRSS